MSIAQCGITARPFAVALMFLYTLSAYTQPLSGRVLDRATRKPIPFATVYLEQTAIGTYADSAGTFNLSVGHHPNRPLTVSALGYTTEKIQPEPGRPVTVYLTEAAVRLNEVVVRKPRETLFEFGSKRRLSIRTFKSCVSWKLILAHRINKPVKGAVVYLAEVSFLAKNESDKPGQLRVILYTPDHTGNFPDSVLSHQVVTVPPATSRLQGSRRMTVPLNSVPIRTDAFFVGIEWIVTSTGLDCKRSSVVTEPSDPDDFVVWMDHSNRWRSFVTLASKPIVRFKAFTD